MPEQSKPPTLIDLFCGCGGMSLGAARAGFNVAAGADKDSRALQTHAANFPNAHHLHVDLSKISGEELLHLAGVEADQLTVLSGGPPCQGFSTIGKRDVADSRNFLIYDFFRLARTTSPKAFVMENVPGLVQAKYESILERALDHVRATYDVLPVHAVRACDVGAPTLRRRVFIVGFSKSLRCDLSAFWDQTEAKFNAPIVRHALSGLPADIHPDWRNSFGGIRTVRIGRAGPFFEAARGRVPEGVGDAESLRLYTKTFAVTGCLGTRHSPDLEARYASLAPGKCDSRTKSVKLDAQGYCPTLRAGTGPERGSFQAVRPIHHSRARVITPREAARLQGFPDWYQFDKTKWHSFRQIGNSVSPIVAEFVMTKVKKALDDAE